MSRYKSNFDYSRELRELRTYTMELRLENAKLKEQIDLLEWRLYNELPRD
jgi:hypothetical protein